MCSLSVNDQGSGLKTVRWVDLTTYMTSVQSFAKYLKSGYMDTVSKFLQPSHGSRCKTLVCEESLVMKLKRYRQTAVVGDGNTNCSRLLYFC